MIKARNEIRVRADGRFLRVECGKCHRFLGEMSLANSFHTITDQYCPGCKDLVHVDVSNRLRKW